MFAATLDIIRHSSAGSKNSRHLLPLINLGSHFRTVAGKTWALLYMLTLVVGPSFNALLFVLGRVRSITTDLGGELMVRDASDCLLGFMKDIGATIPAGARPEQVLFPIALAAPG